MHQLSSPYSANFRLWKKRQTKENHPKWIAEQSLPKMELITCMLTLYLQHLTNFKHLGVTFDPRLTWKEQLQKNKTKAKLRMSLMKKLAGTTWGANQVVLKKIMSEE